MAPSLRRFSPTPQDDGFRILIEDEEGEVYEFDATREQIEIITDELDDLLADSEAEEGDA